MTVPKEKFGRDHWSTFAYLAHVVTAREGVPDRDKMRTHQSHRLIWTQMQAMMHAANPTWSKTLLCDGTEVDEHDDYDCADDLMAAGLLTNRGTGLHPEYGITDEGLRILKLVSEFRRAGVRGRAFQDFRPYDPNWAPIPAEDCVVERKDQRPSVTR